MNEFQGQLNSIKKSDIICFLSSQTMPCYESRLLKLAFPDMDIARSKPLALYQHHFILFHLLYRLQEDFYQKGQYLHIHFMRTCLTDYPPIGTCRQYDEHTGLFCGAGCDDQKHYCPFHLEKIGETEIDALSLKYFYLDTENYYQFDEETAEAFINGAWEILAHYDQYRESFKILGISETFDIQAIKKRFRELAKQHHPDMKSSTGISCGEQFNEINRAYQFLLRVMPFFKTNAIDCRSRAQTV